VTVATTQTVVIGAGGGLGRSLALRFAREGHSVALLARAVNSLDALAAEVRALGVPVAIATTDAAEPLRLADTIRTLSEQLPIGVLIYNAFQSGGQLLSTDLETLRRASDVNLHAPILAVRAALPDLQAHGGSVLFTGGGLALYPDPDVGVLSIGKAAIRAAALVLSADLAPRGVQVRTVTIAGVIRTGTKFDPDRIADAFWALHTHPGTEPELIYAGEPGTA
jgi:short-subunit dehydrogenase